MDTARCKLLGEPFESEQTTGVMLQRGELLLSSGLCIGALFLVSPAANGTQLLRYEGRLRRQDDCNKTHSVAIGPWVLDAFDTSEFPAGLVNTQPSQGNNTMRYTSKTRALSLRVDATAASETNPFLQTCWWSGMVGANDFVPLPNYPALLPATRRVVICGGAASRGCPYCGGGCPDDCENDRAPDRFHSFVCCARLPSVFRFGGGLFAAISRCEEKAAEIGGIGPAGGGFARQKFANLLVDTLGPWIGLERRYKSGYADIFDSSSPRDVVVDADSVYIALQGSVFVWWFHGDGVAEELPTDEDGGWTCIRLLPCWGATIPAGTRHMIVPTDGAVCVLAADSTARKGLSLPESARRAAIGRGVLCARMYDSRLPQLIQQEAEQEYRALIVFYGKRKCVAKWELARDKARRAWAARGVMT